MDQVKIGAFLAKLRREKGWTQAELGERLGVTNKTISRWENANYMPDIEMLRLLSEEFDVTINEILCGERVSDEEYRKKSDENVISLLRQDLFSREERRKFWKRKWLRDRLSWIPVYVILILATAVFVWYHKDSTYVVLAFCGWTAVGIRAKNEMYGYIEGHLYPLPGEEKHEKKR